MNVSKKIISLVLAAFMLQGFSALAQTFSDIQGNQYEKAIEILTSMNVMKGYKGGQFKPDDIITRAEFAAVVAAIVGDIGNSGKPVYEDVPDWHWAASSIYTVDCLKIIQGYGNGKFGPEDEVTYMQAIKMIVSLLGYDLYAENRGGYPMGYFAIAEEEGITNHVTLGQNDPVSRGCVSQLLYNALEVEVVERLDYDERTTFTSTSTKTLLSNKLHMEKIKGRVTGNQYTNLENDQNVISDEIQIDRTGYKMGSYNKKANELLGHQVVAYVREDNISGAKTIVYIESLQRESSILTIVAEDIKSFENHEYSYTETSNKSSVTKTANLSRKADIIYNGKATLFDDANFCPAAGKVVLLDFDENGEYDIAFITEIENYVVHRVNINENIIYAKYGKAMITLDGKKISLVNKQGVGISIESLKEWNVLSIMQSTDEELILMVCVQDVIQDTVTAFLDNTHLQLGNQEYELSNSLAQMDLSLGDIATFYLDIEGKIAAYDKSTDKSDWMYGYVIKAAIIQSGVNKVLQFKLFNQEGKILYINGAEKIKADNVYMDNEQEIFDLLCSDGEFKSQLIRYKTDKQGKLFMMDTTNLNTQNGETEDSLIRVFPVGKDENGVLPYKPSMKSFGGKFSLNEKTIVFHIPYGATGDDRKDEDFKLKEINYFYNDMEPAVAGYITNRNGSIAKVVLDYEKSTGGSEVESEEQVSLVEKIVEAANEDGERVKAMYALKDGKKIVVYAKIQEDGKTLFDSIQTGDAVRFSTDNKNVVTAINLLYDASQQAFDDQNGNKEFPPHFTYLMFRVVFGSVYSVDDKDIKVVVGREEDGGNLIDIKNTDPEYINKYIKNINHIENYNTEHFKIYIYDSGKDKNNVTIGTIDDIKDYANFPRNYSKVLIQTRTGEPRVIIIYK